MTLDNGDLEDQNFGSRSYVTAPWELNDMDFLLPEPVASSTRSYFQDSPRKFCFSLHESEFGYSPELKDSTKLQGPGEEWQDIPLNEYSTSEITSYLADDVFSDKTGTKSKVQASKLSYAKLMPSTDTKLRVHITTCKPLRVREDKSMVLKKDTGVVSPTTVDKKVLVTDNDLRLFSTDTMRELSARKGKSSKRYSKKVNSTAPTAFPSTPSSAQRQLKRCASLELDFNDHFVRALKRTKSLDQTSWSATSVEPRGYCGRTEDFHGMQPKLLSPMHGVNLYHPVQYQIGVQVPLSQFQPQYQAPKRKIGIYSPVERRERLKRFHEKRKHRVYHKRIKYDCRKRLANSCPRIKGRFVRKSEFLQANECDRISSPASSESPSSTEDCQL